MEGGDVGQLAIERVDAPESRTAQLHGAADDRVEDRLHVGLRPADDLENLGRRRLLLSASFVSVNRRTFSIAMTPWAAKVWRSAMCASENGATWSRATKIA